MHAPAGAVFANTPPHRVAWLVTGPRRPRPVFHARNGQNSPTRFPEEALYKVGPRFSRGFIGSSRGWGTSDSRRLCELAPSYGLFARGIPQPLGPLRPD